MAKEKETETDKALQEKIDALTAENKKLQEENKKLKDSDVKSSEEIGSLKKKLSDSEEKAATAQKQLKDNEESQKELDGLIVEKRKQLQETMKNREVIKEKLKEFGDFLQETLK